MWNIICQILILIHLGKSRPRVVYLHTSDMLSRLSKRSVKNLDAKCPTYKSNIELNSAFLRRCSTINDRCQSDKDCGEKRKCCYDGCILSCSQSVTLKGITLKDSTIIDFFPKKTHSLVHLCSSQKLTCPYGHRCELKNPTKLEGFCVPYDNPASNKEVDALKTYVLSEDEKDDLTCFYEGITYNNGECFYKQGDLCECFNTVINCRLTIPCLPLKQPDVFVIGNEVEKKKRKS